MEKKGIERVREIMKTLRSEKGCPWDREQKIETLKPYIIEEAFEVVEAIDGDMKDLPDELGDLLLQVVFVSQIAEESGKFNFDDVCDKISEKLIRRHPHVFGDVTVKDSGDVLKNWNMIKREKEERKNLLDGIPTAMPAMLLAQRYADRAATIGFDWERWEDVIPKFDEEMVELKESIASGNRDEIFHEIGDVLFAAVNLSRKLGINAEEALKGCAKRFKERFTKMEEIKPEMLSSHLSLEALEELWQQAKRELKK